MEGGGRSSEESRAEKLMDDYLKSVGFHRKKVAKDGSCLFRAVAEQVLHCQNLHTEVRANCVRFLRQNRDSYEAFIEGDFEEYLQKLQDPQQWVGEVEINALAIMYKRDFQIFQEVGKPAVSITDNNFKEKVRLCFLNGNHYDSVYPISRVKNAAVCQSILYELLYDGVFKVDRSLLSVCQRSSRQSDLLSDDNMAACQSSDDSDGDTSESLWVENGISLTSTRPNNSQSFRGRGRGRLLPERVRRSLNPTLLRNIEYDVWVKTKKAQQKMDHCIATGMQFNVGDRCQVCLDGNGQSYSATVKEVPVNNGPVKVFIEEVGLRNVPLWSLRPPTDDSSWSKVINRDKKLGEHGEWEERGRGRGRGKGLTASPSMPTGLDRRVQRQTSDDSRKAPSELTFGLTEEQRLFREEEQRNIALVEIQLRDELSFPALGTQLESERGKKGERRRSQKTKAKIPEEVFEVATPSHPGLTPPTPESLESSAPVPPVLDLATLSGSAPAAAALSSNAPLSSASVSEPPSVAPPLTSVVLTSSTDAPSSSAPSSATPADPSPPPSEAPPLPSCPEVPQNKETSEGLSTFSQDSPAPPPVLPAPPPVLPAPPPLQCLPPVYHDPLYPGFPQAPGGGVAPTPPFSRSQSGDDLPSDMSLLRFFFNLGLKAYSLPMYAPYIYLCPLQHMHMLQTTNPQQPPPVSSPWQQTLRPPSFPTPYPHPDLQLPSLHPPTNGALAPAPLPPPPPTAVNDLLEATAALGFSPGPTPSEQPSNLRAPGSDPVPPQPGPPHVLSELTSDSEAECISMSKERPDSSGPAAPPYPEVAPALMSVGDTSAHPPFEQQWEPMEELRTNQRGFKKNYRGRRGRGRAPPRRRYGELESGFGYNQFTSPLMGRGQDRGY